MLNEGVEEPGTQEHNHCEGGRIMEQISLLGRGVDAAKTGRAERQGSVVVLTGDGKSEVGGGFWYARRWC